MALKKSESRVFTYLIMIILIMLTDSLLFATNSIYSFIVFKRVLTIVLAGILLIYKLIKKDNRYYFTIILLSAFIMLSMVAAENSIGWMYITQIAVFVCAISVFSFYNFETFRKAYVNIIRIIAIVSLLGFFFSTSLKRLPFFPIVTNSTGASFKFLLFTNIPLDYTLSQRNWGPFWEPGAFQMYLNIAFIFALFGSYKKRRIKYIDVFLFAFTCLTTKSGASFIPLICALVAYLLSKTKDRKILKITIIAVVGIGLIILAQTDMFSRAFEKTIFGLDSGDNTSFVYRLSAAITYIKAFFHSPIWGNSAQYLEESMKILSNEMFGITASGNTNTMLAYFAYYGIVPAVIIAVNLFKSTKKLSNGIIPRLFLFVGLIMMTSNENFMCSLIFSCVLFMNLGALEKGEQSAHIND